MKVGRINGLDVAFALSIPWIIFNGSFLEVGQRLYAFERDQFHLILDGGVAAFLFLFGLTTGLKQVVPGGLFQNQKYLVARGLLFVVIGAALSLAWSTNLYMLLGLGSILVALLLPLSSTVLFFVASLLTFGALGFYFFSPSAVSLSPWAAPIPKNAVSNFLMHGYYAALPWLFFPVAGLLYSRTDFLRYRSRNFLMFVGLGLIAAAFALEFLFESFVGMGNISSRNTFTEIGVLHLTLPSFFVGGFGFSMLILHLAVIINEKFNQTTLIGMFRKTGRLKYTSLLLYGLGILVASLLLSGEQTFGIRNIIILSFLLFAGTLVFNMLWLKRFNAGPVEMVLQLFSKKK